jgi:alpha-beta hydrolase superfamily lysophospholipase
MVTMGTYVLIHGGGDSAFYWHLLAPALRERGHEVVAMDLPCGPTSKPEFARSRAAAPTAAPAPVPG